MNRLLALGIAVSCLLALGCASQPTTSLVQIESATARVAAGPPDCDSLHARIHRSEARFASRTGTWLDSPNRMVESRRLHALHARAERLGCSLPRI